jgi:hypothetical protein
MSSQKSPESVLGPAVAFGMHTVAVYFFAVRVSPWVTFHLFRWVVPILPLAINVLATDWYLQHLIILSIVPGLIAGFVVGRVRNTVATWAWVVPTVILAYRMVLQYGRTPMSTEAPLFLTFEYFFDIEKIMPTAANPTVGDPIRVLAQMMVTAPFCTGVAYSVGAIFSKRRIFEQLRSRVGTRWIPSH